MLKLFYVCLFVTSGVSVPFFPTYLRALGLNGTEVSWMMSVAPVFHLFVPLAWGWLSDRTQRPDRLLRIACAGAAVCITPLIGLGTVPLLLAVYAGHQLFAVPILGLADSLALDRMRRMGEDYTRVRLWGSASFLVVCFIVGKLIEARGHGPSDALVPTLIAAGFALAALAAFGLRGAPGRPPPHFHEVRALLANRRFLFILVLAPLHWAALTPYHGFLGILALDRGFATTTVSDSYFLAVLAEVGTFIMFPRLRQRFSLEALLAVVAAVSAVRWLLIGGLPFGPLAAHPLVALQATHAFSFGLYWACAMAWLADAVPPQLRATGQAMFTAATFGVGNLVGFNTAGHLYDATGGAEAAFRAAGVVELVPLAMALVAHARRRRV
jgi:MFS transporter, PPP family, 3-phenylpropionic acid transporter